MFFPDTDRPDAKLTPADLTYAARLRAVVVRTPGRRSKWRRSVWADEFRILRQELAADSSSNRIETVLAWYERAAGKARVPNVRSAAAFRRNFDWLSDLSAKVAAPVAMSGDLDALAVRLYGRLKRLPWGTGTESLEEVVRLAVFRHQQMLERWRLAVAGEQVSVRTIRFANWARGRLLSPESFLYADFAGLQPGLAKWADWTGNWDGQAFAAGGERFVKRVVALAREFGDIQCGRDFLAAVKP